MTPIKVKPRRLRRRGYVHLLVMLLLAGCLAGCTLLDTSFVARTDAMSNASAAVTRSNATEPLHTKTVPQRIAKQEGHDVLGDTLRLVREPAQCDVPAACRPERSFWETESIFACWYTCRSLWSLRGADTATCEHAPTVDSNRSLGDVSEPHDLWERLRRGFAIPAQDNPRIIVNLAWYKRHPAYLNRIAKRASRYLYWITEAIESRGMPSEIALLPVIESAFQPFAYSDRRAAGIWQFIPSTGRLYGLKQNWWYDGRRDIAASTQAALTYLDRLLEQFDGNWLLALAAYNSGQGTVEAAIRKNRRHGKPTDFWSLDLPKETRDYVPKLLAIAALVKDPETHGLKLTTIANEPYITRLEIDSQIDLRIAAKLADLGLKEMYMLNPGFNRWATDPKGPHELMLPVDNVALFRKNLEQLPQTARVKWERHHVRRGETLLHIAARYDTDTEAIRRLNQIRGDLIRAGQSLIVPVSSRHLPSYTLNAGQRLQHQHDTRSQDGAVKMIYRVRHGGTLWDISRKFGVSMRQLAKWNGLLLKDTLRPEQQLVVWLKQADVKHIAFSPEASRLATRKIYYRVRRGESLALIAHRFRVSVKNLLRWNQIRRPNLLQPGDELTLFVDIAPQTGI